MTLLERLLAARTGGIVERCHGILHKGSYSVASHTWGMLALLYLLFENDFARLAPYAMFHDVPEAWVGDIPAPVKKYSRAVKQGAELMERAIFDRLQLPNYADLNPEDKRKLRACDSLELYLWAKEEVGGGNMHALCVVRELDRFFEEDPLPEPAAGFYVGLGEPLVYATDRVIHDIIMGCG